MADTAEEVVQQAVQNASETLSATKVPASPEGAAMAYGSLVIMAMLPIFFGALRSVKHQKDQKVRNIAITILLHQSHVIQVNSVVAIFRLQKHMLTF